jgi:hypothetical protein
MRKIALLVAAAVLIAAPSAAFAAKAKARHHGGKAEVEKADGVANFGHALADLSMSLSQPYTEASKAGKGGKGHHHVARAGGKGKKKKA